MGEQCTQLPLSGFFRAWRPLKGSEKAMLPSNGHRTVAAREMNDIICT